MPSCSGRWLFHKAYPVVHDGGVAVVYDTWRVNTHHMATTDDFVTFRQIVEEIIHGPGCNCNPTCRSWRRRSTRLRSRVARSANITTGTRSPSPASRLRGPVRREHRPAPEAMRARGRDRAQGQAGRQIGNCPTRSKESPIARPAPESRWTSWTPTWPRPAARRRRSKSMTRAPTSGRKARTQSPSRAAR